jgi:GNAT superfamily N-acetyltransferase
VVTDVASRITIRPATRADLTALVAALGQPQFFADRLGRARHNGGDLLVAWLDGVPVGNVFLWCEALEEPELREAFPDAPLLNHLEVAPAVRGHGIGTALVRACEKAARRRGYDILLLGVGVDNPEARRLYERLGYVDWGLGPIVARWTEPDGAGGFRFAELTCDTLVMSLKAPVIQAWIAWRPDEIATRLSGVDLPWHVVGGWALELWRSARGLGALREHGDVEIAIPRPEFGAIAAALRGLDLYAVGHGAIRPLPAGAEPRSEVRQVWVAEGGAYRMDVFLEAGDGATWKFRRDERITRPYPEAISRTSDGVPFLRPETVLLYKARAPRAKDEADFAAVRPDLDPAGRQWLVEALATAYPGHPWIAMLV